MSTPSTLARTIAFLGHDPLPPGVTIPERLRQKWRQLGWGQRELAEHLGVDASTISNSESGRTSMATAHRRLIATFLEVPVAELDATMRKRWNDSHGRLTWGQASDASR